MEYEEPTIIDAPGYVGKTVFDPQGKAIDRQVKADERFITTEIGPIALGPGEELSILDEEEKGEIIYIKIVTDNPYANVYLELDDYRNDQNGETHAELLYDQRKSNAEDSFTSKLTVLTAKATLWFGTPKLTRLRIARELNYE